jgi:hypothetical protein
MEFSERTGVGHTPQTVLARRTRRASGKLPDLLGGLKGMFSISSECPLSGAKRTSRCERFMSAFDPKWRDYVSALLFVQLRIGFIRRRLGFGALGFAQRSVLVSLSLFLLAPSTCRPRSLGSISSVIWLKCHHVPRCLITRLSALYKHVAMPSHRHLCSSNS